METSRIVIVTPASAADNNGNWLTASRWRNYLLGETSVTVAQDWAGDAGAPADAMIALHARKSAPAIERWREQRNAAPLALVLTGTDLYRDIDRDPRAARMLELADDIVVLQREALTRLAPAARAKAVVILQSAPQPPGPQLTVGSRPDLSGPAVFVAVGHLREAKDPLTLLAAVRALVDAPDLRIEHIGAPLEPSLADAASKTQADCPWYRWLGALPHDETLARIAGATALLHPSRIEGGAHVVIEAVRAGVPVIASRIDGNVGLLGRHYTGYVPVGDARALAAAIRRCVADPAWLQALRDQCALVEPMFRPEREAAAVRALAARLLRRADRSAGDRPRP